MHHELVDKRRWISERRYLHALNYCMLLPGPEATQLAIYISWLIVLFGAQVAYAYQNRQAYLQDKVAENVKIRVSKSAVAGPVAGEGES